ncbi:response regulator transcription factor [Flavobacterium sp. SUN052]|uniref:response regulator transcription factor n=1 Tax=Flavobacterium sp. SUN052 TaxID=3002441 RepID=UPI00237D7681|nr:response regulator transcription factor [Flavobacterium sp. SUN052]MEC4003027.1 response regulator transcription factor [Flavobacterium sp. SUN052]
MTDNINILLVDDHLVVRKGIELIIRDKFTNVIIHQAENYTEALEVLNVVTIDLIVLDIIINGIENIKIMKTIKNVQKNTKILIFSCHEEEFYGVRYMKNGADGFLNKFCDENKIEIALKEMLTKGKYYSDEIRFKLKNNKTKNLQTNSIDILSNREFEIAKMLIDGCGNLEIANKLKIQMSTVSTYKNRVFEKLNINNIVTLSSFFKEKID